MPATPDPPLDHELSPHTGWTRAHWEATADRMLLALRPFATPGRARFDLPGPASRAGRISDGLEGFARSFLLAAFRLRGANGDDPHGFAAWYADGLTAGTDPASGDAWPSVIEVGQARVEAASVAIALHETRPWIWDRLDPGTRERVIGWLSGMIGVETPVNNWVWFRAISNAVLRSLGGPSDERDIATAIELTDAWYPATAGSRTASRRRAPSPTSTTTTTGRCTTTRSGWLACSARTPTPRSRPARGSACAASCSTRST